jgi:hypothetical protein
MGPFLFLYYDTSAMRHTAGAGFRSLNNTSLIANLWS